ncbi:MAG: sigma-70 family RNA polymerase sigma factor [Planctomycetota bacterium]
MPAEGEQNFEALAVPHLESVYRIARRLTRDSHEAEDLVQETYLKAYKAFANYEVRDFGIRPWLLKILHNAFFNRRARQKRAPRSVDQQTLEQMHSDSREMSPPDLDYEHLDEEVKQAIDRLPEEFRVVILLWATKEVSYQEIAEIIDVPIGTVMSRLHRARQQLVRGLDAFAREHRLTASTRKS